MFHSQSDESTDDRKDVGDDHEYGDEAEEYYEDEWEY